MQYRIKKVIDWYDLSESYYPQYKFLWLFRCDFTYDDWFMSWIEKFDTLEEAKAFIDKERWEKCSSISYINY